MRKLLFALLVILSSCKKDDAGSIDSNNPTDTHTYQTITYIAYGTHNFYDVAYIEKGVEKYAAATASSNNKNWSYSFKDTVGAPLKLVYISSASSSNDTMTIKIFIDNAMVDSKSSISTRDIIGLTH